MRVAEGEKSAPVIVTAVAPVEGPNVGDTLVTVAVLE